MQCITNPFSRAVTLAALFGIAGLLPAALARNGVTPTDSMHQDDATTEPSRSVNRPLNGPAKQNKAPSAPVIGPGDEIEVTVYGAPDLSQHSRVNGNGNISMPLIGYVRLAGLSSSEAELAIANQLRQGNVINDPNVSVYVKEYASSGISVAGEVARPGVYSAVGPHRLFDILHSAGGLTERAASRATISHRGDENPSTVELSAEPLRM